MHPAGAMEGERLGSVQTDVDDAGLDHHEVEWQLDATDLRPLERAIERGEVGEVGGGALTIGAPDVATIADTYLDTEDWRFRRAGYALRVRRCGGAIEATLKALVPATDGLARRREVTERVEPMSGNGDGPA